VGISGTGGGFKKFCRGEIDIANASRPMSKEEEATCAQAAVKYEQLPICQDAITLVVSKNNDWLSSITVEELKRIWEPAAQGKITHWNQIRSTWPNEKIKLYGAGSDSGTFDYFTEVIVGKAKASRGDYTPSEDDNVLVRGVEGDKFALAYIPYAYYSANHDQLKALAIGSGSGAPVLPSHETIINGSYTPLARPLYFYVNLKSKERAEVAGFIGFFLENATSLVKEVDYVPLSAETYAKELSTFKQRG